METHDEIYLMVNEIMILFVDIILFFFLLGLHDFLPVDEQSWFLEYLDHLKSTSSALISSDDSL